MSSSLQSKLDDLFEQIISSERIANEKKSHLQEIKCHIRQTEASILQLKQEKDALRRELATKVTTMNQEEVNLMLLNNKKKILSSQKCEYQTQRTELETELENLGEELLNMDEKFCSDVESFVTEFGLLGNGQDLRRESTLKELSLLSQRKTHLQQSIHDYEEHMQAVGLIRSEETTLIDQLQTTEVKLTEVCQIYDIEKQKLIEQEDEKEKVQMLPSTDAEFLRLQAELDTVKGEDMESVCHQLQQKIQILQQQLWQKNVKVRQQQKQQQTVRQQQKRTFHQTDKTTQQDEDMCEVSTSNRVCVSNFTRNMFPSNVNSAETAGLENMDADNLDAMFEDDLMSVSEDTSITTVQKS